MCVCERTCGRVCKWMVWKLQVSFCHIKSLVHCPGSFLRLLLISYEREKISDVPNKTLLRQQCHDESKSITVHLGLWNVALRGEANCISGSHERQTMLPEWLVPVGAVWSAVFAIGIAIWSDLCFRTGLVLEDWLDMGHTVDQWATMSPSFSCDRQWGMNSHAVCLRRTVCLGHQCLSFLLRRDRWGGDDIFARV